MARNIECDRCHMTTRIGIHQDWANVEISGEHATETRHELCPSCRGDLYSFLKVIEQPKLITSEFCDYERHVFRADSGACQCSRYKLTIADTVEYLPDEDIKF